MKAFLRLALLFLVSAAFAFRLAAHDHIEVGVDPADATRLGFDGPGYQLALYVPLGEPFSAYLPHFPGGAYPAELTFAAEGNVLDIAAGSLPKIEVISVTGPAGAQFSFWEVAATTPTWTRPTGWTSSAADRPAIIVYENLSGYGHIHGRAFSVDQPGTYQVVFRAMDAAGLYATSLPKTVTFNALATPQLALRIESGNAVLSFPSRAGLTYDLQLSTDLQTWTNIEAHRFIDGTGATLELTDPLADRPRVFYRLVEYY
ncbi:hypothetical protein IMCC26134_11455 [Verrucomicrobia bacterium IMCC26134]|nr:hypothetical protein IMCC26134_11455 [Verrucomicrobia bacterium IMCC26134]